MLYFALKIIILIYYAISKYIVLLKLYSRQHINLCEKVQKLMSFTYLLMYFLIMKDSI